MTFKLSKLLDSFATLKQEFIVRWKFGFCYLKIRQQCLKFAEEFSLSSFFGSNPVPCEESDGLSVGGLPNEHCYLISVHDEQIVIDEVIFVEVLLFWLLKEKH